MIKTYTTKIQIPGENDLKVKVQSFLDRPSIWYGDNNKNLRHYWAQSSISRNVFGLLLECKKHFLIMVYNDQLQSNPEKWSDNSWNFFSRIDFENMDSLKEIPEKFNKHQYLLVCR